MNIRFKYAAMQKLVIITVLIFGATWLLFADGKAQWSPEPWGIAQAGGASWPGGAQWGYIQSSPSKTDGTYSTDSNGQRIFHPKDGVDVISFHVKEDVANPKYLKSGEGLANAERIIACVNGLAGIKNPAAVKRVIEAAKKLSVLTAANDDMLAKIKSDLKDNPVVELEAALRDLDREVK